MGAMAAPTFQELYDLGRAEALARRPSMAFKPGDVSDMVLGGAAAIGDRLVGYAAERFKATYVDGARQADLTTLADDHWSIQRQDAAQSAGTVRFTRSLSAGVLSIATGTVVATSRDALGNEIRFVTTAPLSWANLETGSKSAAAQAEDGGVAGNVAAAAITRLVTTLTEGGVTVTNLAAFTGGAAEESDDELRARIRAFPATIRRATIPALEYGAMQVAGVKRATAVEDVTGLVTVYVTDAEGASTGSPLVVDAGIADDGSMTAKVAIELQNWRAAGAVVSVVGGVLLEVDMVITLTVRAGVDIAAIQTKAQEAAEARAALLQIGETIYRSAIQAAVRNVDPVNILEVGLTMRTGADPYTDVFGIAPDTNEIIRAGSVTVT